jgi:hypothetical protein
VFAAANVATTGFTLNGSGSLTLGSYTLTASLPFVYTYTGGAFSQATTVPAFAGGTLNIGAAGTYTFDTSGTVIVSMTPTAPGTYAMSGVTAGTQLDLRNTSAHAITVELSTEAAAVAITSNNTGGTITVSAPQIYQSVTITGFTVGTGIEIYDYGVADVQLFNGTASAGNTVISGSTCTWTDNVAAAAQRDIRVRLTYQSGVTAKEMIEANIGSCGTTEPSNAVSYVATQTNDTTYNTNAIDGSTVTGITIVDATNKVQIAIAGGSVTWPQIYAYQVYWLHTDAGREDDFAFIEAPDTANYLLTGFQIKNTSSPTVPLVISSGYGRDATTEASVDLVDTTGGTLIFAPDHVVAYSSGSGLTPGQDANLTAIKLATDAYLDAAVSDVPTGVLTAATSAPIAANIKKVNDITVTGTGVEGDTWGP